jgi:hypothetical protein
MTERYFHVFSFQRTVASPGVQPLVVLDDSASNAEEGVGPKQRIRQTVSPRESVALLAGFRLLEAKPPRVSP